ncbi:MAG TPA: hypothetical protein VG897_16755 [Terriglobales bacterium]|nr:hypothetical protein [Terriglobales bacterium]
MNTTAQSAIGLLGINGDPNDDCGPVRRRRTKRGHCMHCLIAEIEVDTSKFVSIGAYEPEEVIGSGAGF